MELQIRQRNAEYQRTITEMQQHLQVYIVIIASVISALLILTSMQVMEENHQAELRRRGADISRLEEQLAQCHVQMNDSETPIPVRILLSKF